MVLHGELIAESRFEPERLFREWLEADNLRVIINCRGLTQIDSGGLSILLGALHRYRQRGGDVVLAEMNPQLNAMFEVTSMEKYFNVFAGNEDALHHFSQQGREKSSHPTTA